jgi:hypothetical protein
MSRTMTLLAALSMAANRFEREIMAQGFSARLSAQKDTILGEPANR